MLIFSAYLILFGLAVATWLYERFATRSTG